MSTIKTSSSLKEISAHKNHQYVRNLTHPYQHSKLLPHKYPESKPFEQNPTMQSTNAIIKCQAHMISSERFAVQSTSYTQLVDVFKSISSANYDTTTGVWDFAISDYYSLQERLKTLKPKVVFGPIPKNVVKLCLQSPKIYDASYLASIESTLVHKLLPFQQESICFAIAQRGRIMICDEMGLGKTYQAIALADFYKEHWPVLIVTTASTRDNWAKHVSDLLPNVPVPYIQVLTNSQDHFHDAKVLITSYTIMEKLCNKFLENNFGVLIFDESHALKNTKAKCTIVANRLSRQARHVLLLTGTPALSRPLELFSQLQMVDPNFFNFMDFTTRYCDGKYTQFGWNASGQSNLQELHVVLKLKFMIRRTKEEALPSLSTKSRETIILDSTLIGSSEANSLNKYLNDYNNSKGKSKEEILVQYYAETARAKTVAVCSYIKGFIKENIKCIIFGHHRVMLDAISEILMKQNVDFVRIDGSTKNELRMELINKFQNDTTCQVALLSLKACNSGITLTAAEMVIFAELDWNPSTLVQAESRAHRIGQERNVVCRYLIAQKTADDLIWNMLKHKQDTLSQAGLFCENLHDATNFQVPSTLNDIQKYCLPKCSNLISNSSIKENVVEGNSSAEDGTSKSCCTETNAFFEDDDDIFMDLKF